MAFVDEMYKVISGDMSTTDYIASSAEGKLAHVMDKDPDGRWVYDIQVAQWAQIRDAHKNGKKLVAFGGPMPVDIIYAFDCQPYYLDQLPLSTAPKVDMTAKFIDICETKTNQSMCSIDKVEMGVLLADQYGIKPDAFVYSTVPCDSSRIAYPIMEKIWNVPTFNIDLPFRRDERGVAYLVKQTKEFITFMEEFTGKKLDWNKLKECMEVANKSNELIGKIADLRSNTPCPLPGILLVTNACMSGQAADPEMVKFLEKEYETGQMMVELGMGACMNGEKYRMLFLQNMFWTQLKAYSYLEREYGAICIMDVLGHYHPDIYENLDDKEDCFKVMAVKMMNLPMIHGAAGPVDYYCDRIKYLMDNFNINASIFLGHIGCKHTWASTKILSDYIQENYGMPTLLLDVDCIDGRYKTAEEVQDSIVEYLENVVKL
ncbi:MAG: 2-hydroxyacyl-CoA dehydratase [Clostridiales bacterium]|jgi:benzoyl-CoA reductase/2-hydroxyglutaryl-CoA dehydratase subunit BcrC/BadD/HgdB|nr:2-hydroxyacyl-CoA dehydratase [Clostridiales bacterium]